MPEQEAGRSVGLVLSGGGARGAYEAGALLHVAEHLPELLPRIRVICGTSVGAVNAAFLAGKGLTREGIRDLAALWRGLEIDRVISLAPAATLELLGVGSLRLLGRDVPSPAMGLLSVAGISRLVTARVDWPGIRRNVRSGRFDAVAVAATDIGVGTTHLFVTHREEITPNWSGHDPTLIPRRVVLRPHHILASAAIPILFPPVRVAGRWYMDGGVRYNTPLSPALSLGAESLMIVAVRAPIDASRPSPTTGFPGFGQVLGKLLDSVFLDRVAYDLDRLLRINDMVESVELLGPEAVARLQVELIRRGRRSYRKVATALVRPSTDLGALAADYLGRAAKAKRLSFARVLKALFQDDSGTTGDAASFLLFDGAYADALIEAGRRDAAAAHDSLAAL